MWRSFVVIASILAGCLIAGLLVSQATVSQEAPTLPPLPTSGRYQVSITSTSTHPSADATHFVVLCDTASGQCWIRGTGFGEWHDLGNPTVAKARQPNPGR